jgi:hypothetical protein
MSVKGSKGRKSAPASPQHFHLDKRAAGLATVAGDDDELLDTKAEAKWLGVSEQWLEIGRVRGYGLEYERLAPRVIRYQRGKTRRWLAERSHRCTSEYKERGVS